MKELKKLDQHEVKISGTLVTMNPKTAHLLAAAADVDAQDESHIVPRNDLDINNDFQDIWLVCDYSSVNEGDNAGFVAIHLMNALNTGGFQIKTSDKAKGQFSFEFTGHLGEGSFIVSAAITVSATPDANSPILCTRQKSIKILLHAGYARSNNVICFQFEFPEC